MLNNMNMTKGSTCTLGGINRAIHYLSNYGRTNSKKMIQTFTDGKSNNGINCEITEYLNLSNQNI